MEEVTVARMVVNDRGLPLTSEQVQPFQTGLFFTEGKPFSPWLGFVIKLLFDGGHNSRRHFGQMYRTTIH